MRQKKFRANKDAFLFLYLSFALKRPGILIPLRLHDARYRDLQRLYQHLFDDNIPQSVKDYGESIGAENLPIIIGITNNYSHRPQSVFYTHTRKWKIGLKLFLSDLSILTSPGSPYEKLRVMIHLDHIQWDKDGELLNWDMNQFSSIMFDASTLPLDKNIEKTAAFVEENKNKILIEGECHEISSAGSGEK